MKRSTQYKTFSILILGLLLIGFNQCVGPLEKSENGAAFSKHDLSPAPVNTSPARTANLNAFSKTVYPITRARCVSCHGNSQTPLHASSNINVAFDALVSTSKIDFSNPGNSRIVLKLKDEEHNCWGVCADNAEEIRAQIVKWNEMVSNNTTSPPVDDGRTTKESVSVSEIINPTQTPGEGTLTLMAESASLKAPMVAGAENGVSYIWTPLNSGVRNLNSNNAGTGSLIFQVPMSDTYKVHMYVSTPGANNGNSVYVKVAGGNYKEWFIGATNGFAWKELKSTSANLETTFDISAGQNFNVEIRQKDPGIKVSKVIITNNPTYNPAAANKNNLKGTLKLSLANLTGVPGASLEVDVEEFDMYSYKLSNLKIVTSEDLKIKKVKVLVNGIFNSQNSTYLSVDKVITSAAPAVSNASMILLKDKGIDMDKLSFSFDVIEKN